jgi:uncharacterized membrane protein YgcG
MNSRKREFGDVLDPFEVEDGFFAIDLVSLKAVPGPRAGDRRAEIVATIERLGLDGADYASALEDYFHEFSEGHVTFDFLRRRAPFLARELERQGRLGPSDGHHRRRGGGGNGGGDGGRGGGGGGGSGGGDGGNGRGDGGGNGDGG